MCFAQGHNAVMLVRLEPASFWSKVKHSTTEPLRFHTSLMPLKLKSHLIAWAQNMSATPDSCACKFDSFLCSDVLMSADSLSEPFGPGSNGLQREKTCLQRFANNKGTDQPVHPHSLIIAFLLFTFGKYHI